MGYVLPGGAALLTATLCVGLIFYVFGLWVDFTTDPKRVGKRIALYGALFAMSLPIYLAVMAGVAYLTWAVFVFLQ